MSGLPPLLCLHGFLGCGDDAAWLGSVAGLPRIAPDLPGHGTSPDLAPLGTDPATSFEACLAWLEAQVADHDAIDVLGYSMGGRLAYGLLCRKRIAIRRAVIIGAHPGIEDPGERRARAAADETLAARLERGPLDAWLERWYDAPLFGDIRAAPAYEEMLSRRRRGDPSSLAEALRLLGPGCQPSYWDALGDVAADGVLLIAGTRDTKYAAVNERVAAALPDALTVSVLGADHAPQIEQPVSTRAVVEAYLGT